MESATADSQIPLSCTFLAKVGGSIICNVYLLLVLSHRTAIQQIYNSTRLRNYITMFSMYRKYESVLGKSVAVPRCEKPAPTKLAATV
eukprot:SAG11_NODE_3371_length_2492_cov_1.677810_1_plen_88_part_00